MPANDPTDKAASFLNWLAAGREFCDPADITDLRGCVLTRERAFLAALEGTTAPAAPATTPAPVSDPTGKAAPPERRGGGAHRTTSAVILDDLRTHPNTTGHDIVERLTKARADVSRGSINAALFRLSHNGTVKKTGKRGDYHFAVKNAA